MRTTCAQTTFSSSLSRSVTYTRAPRALYQSPRPYTVRINSSIFPSRTYINPRESDADIVCARAKNHYTPGQADFTDTQTHDLSDTRANEDLEKYKANFKPPHANIAKTMYFSVRSTFCLFSPPSFAEISFCPVTLPLFSCPRKMFSQLPLRLKGPPTLLFPLSLFFFFCQQSIHARFPFPLGIGIPPS
jgi:hypothetical protein